MFIEAGGGGGGGASESGEEAHRKEGAHLGGLDREGHLIAEMRNRKKGKGDRKKEKEKRKGRGPPRGWTAAAFRA